MEHILSPTAPDLMIQQSRDEIESIKTAAGLPENHFRALCIPALRAYASYVQNLPLAATHFSDVGGAWRFGLIASMIAYRYSKTLLFFPSIGAEERRVLEPQCQYFAFLATLATGLSYVAGNAKVTFEEDEYHPLMAGDSLFEWLKENGSAQFAWRPIAGSLSPQASAAIAARFIPKGLLQDFDVRPTLMFYESVSPKLAMNGLESTLSKVVRESITRVLEHYAQKDGEKFVPAASRLAIDGPAIAGKLVATAQPGVEPINPLEDRTPAVPGRATPASATTPSTHLPDPPAAVADAGDLLRGASPVLVQWFAALKKHPNFEKLHGNLETTHEGIAVPLTMLGLFGVTSPTIRKLMEDAKIIVRRSDDAKSLILHPGLQSHFMPDGGATNAATPSAAT